MRARADTLSADTLADQDETAASLSSLDEPHALGRYEALGLLGRGGMGEVHRVRDPMLQRSMAMKLLREELRVDPRANARFVEEARLTAQLQHPGIIPVHELWHLPDGSPYFTMEEVRGRTLRAVIDTVHTAARQGAWRPAPDGWTLRRLIEAMRRVAETIAFAHARGVLHRDLKPSNIMVGDYGEVLVLDWGLARPADAPAGGVAGTPGFMAPEVAQGASGRVGPLTDVYALGATLHVVLRGVPPSADPDPGLVGSGGAPIPEELRHVVLRACAPAPADRYPQASALADALSGWLEGASRRERALRRVVEADAAAERAGAEWAASRRLRAEAAEVAASLRPWDEEEKKAPCWALEDEAARLEMSATLAELRRTELLAAALTEVPDLPEAHMRLADHYQALAAAAERQRDRLAAARYIALVAVHDRGEHAPWLAGQARFTLITDPPGRATLFRYEEVRRRLVPTLVRELGSTPLIDVSVPFGSYLVIVEAPGFEPLRYPVALDRLERWHGVPPGEREPLPVPLAPLSALAPDEVYVSPGWFRSGDVEPTAHGLPPRTLWLDGFVMRRFPLTNAEVLALANALVAEGREHDALGIVPWDKAAQRPAYARDQDGLFSLPIDADGDAWHLQWPVFLVDWPRALALARAFAERDGLPWRLPYEFEWEKAARGVDGRKFPWGDFADPTWANLRQARPGDHPVPAVVGAYPTDESPYGVRGLAGGVVDWCMDRFEPGGPPVLDGRMSADQGEEMTGNVPRAVRGGAFSFFEGGAVLGRRVGVAPALVDYNVGVRLVRPWPPRS